jgi:hypothetical protein
LLTFDLRLPIHWRWIIAGLGVLAGFGGVAQSADVNWPINGGEGNSR